jgi:hypothetical protein
LALVKLHKEIERNRTAIDMPTTSENLRVALKQKNERMQEMLWKGMTGLPSDQFRQRVIEQTGPMDGFDSTNGGIVTQTGKALARGATAEGIYAGGEGIANFVGNLVTKSLPEIFNKLEELRDMRSGLSPQEVEQRKADRAQQYAKRSGDAVKESGLLRKIGEYADTTKLIRQNIRTALEIDQQFAESKTGQIAQGFGQMAGTVAAGVTSGPAGVAAMSIGQIYDEGYQDAKQSGADDATAHSTAMKYLPAASLDFLSDNLIVGKLLKPLVGKITVGRFIKEVLVSGAVEGTTEGAQQLYLNQVAKRLQGYDPDRPFDQEVYDSILVGAIVGGGVTAVGEGVKKLGEEKQQPKPAPATPVTPQAKQGQPAQPIPPADNPNLGETGTKLGSAPAAPVASQDGKTVSRWTFTDKAGTEQAVDATGLKDALSKLPEGYEPDLKKTPRQEAIAAPADQATPQDLSGKPIDKEWTAFSPESNSLGIPRAEMPQVKAEHRGALTQFLKGKGIESVEEEVLPGTLKPTQAEFSPAKVDKARGFEGGDRAILVSSDGHVVDGHHQWMAKLTDEPNAPMRVIRLDAPIKDLIETVKEFPSAETQGKPISRPAASVTVKPAGAEATKSQAKPAGELSSQGPERGAGSAPNSGSGVEATAPAIPPTEPVPAGVIAPINSPEAGPEQDFRIPQPQTAFKLPRELAGAKPRYSFGSKQFTLKFSSELDKALYILAQPKPSARDADFAKAVMDQTGITEAAARAAGAKVRERIKAIARGAEAGELVVPEMAPRVESPARVSVDDEAALEAVLQAQAPTGQTPASNKQETKPAEAAATLSQSAPGAETKTVTPPEQQPGRRMDEPDAPVPTSPSVTIGDIPLDLAERAHSGTSWTPDLRARGEQRQYVKHMNAVWDSLQKRAENDEQRATAATEFARYRDGWLANYKSLLSVRSRLASSMIAGASKFPAARQQKVSGAYDKRQSEFIAWDKRAQKAMNEAVRPTPPRSASADRSDAVEVLQKKINDAKELQERMKAANAIVRNKKLTDAEKIARLSAEVNISEPRARELLKPDFANRIGFADFELTNNNANIRRMEDRVAAITRNRAQPAMSAVFEGGRVEENEGANRIQIFFDSKPDDAMRDKLKANGFKWAPTEGAWQRQRTDNARYATEQLLGVKLSVQAADPAATGSGEVAFAPEAVTEAPPSAPAEPAPAQFANSLGEDDQSKANRKAVIALESDRVASIAKAVGITEKPTKAKLLRDVDQKMLAVALAVPVEAPAPAVPLAPPQSFRDTRTDLLVKINDALKTAPSEEDFTQQAQIDAIESRKFRRENAKQRQDEAEWVVARARELAAATTPTPQITIQSGNTKFTVSNTKEVLTRLQTRVDKRIAPPTNPAPRETGRALNKSEMDGIKAGRIKLDTAEGRALLDYATEKQLEDMGLADKYERIAPGVVMPKAAAQALRDLKAGKQRTFDIQAAISTPAESDVDQTAPNAQQWQDIADEQLDPVERDRIRDFEARLNRERRAAGQDVVRLTAQAPGLYSESGSEAGSSESSSSAYPGAVRALSQAFGKRIIFYRASAPIGQVGMTAPDRSNTILVNTAAEQPMHVIVGHELAHNMNAQRPDLFDRLSTVVDRLAPMPSDFARTKLNQGYSPEEIRTEWTGDVLGERMDEPEFWSEFARLSGESGGKAKQVGAMRELAIYMRDWFDRMKSRLVRLFSDTHMAVNDLSELQTRVAKIMTEYSGQGPYAEFPDGLISAATSLEMATAKTERTEAPESASKPAPVPGRPGWFYRSEPDSLRAAGLRVVRQVYQRRPQATAQEAAEGIIEAVGEETATRLSLDKNENGVPGDVKTVLYGEILNRQAKIIADSMATALEKAKAQRRIQQLDAVKAPQFTERGQEISALQKVYANARAAGLSEYMAGVQADQKNAMGGDRVVDEVGKAADELGKVNAGKVDDALSGAESKINDIEVDVPLWQKYRDRAAQQIFDWLDGIAAPPKEMAPVEEFTRRLVAEIRARMQETMPDASKSDRPEPTASDMLREAIENSDKYAEAVETIRDRLVEEYGEGSPVIDELDITLGNIDLRPYSRRLLDKAVDEAHVAMKTNIREIAKLHYTKADRLHRSMADALVEVAGLKEPQAKRLADDLAARMQELTKEAKLKALSDLRKKHDATPNTKRALNAIQRAVLLNNYGAMTKAEMADVVAKELKMPHVTPEQMANIAGIAERIETAPNHSEKARAELDMLRELRITRGITRLEVGTSIWYANLLSGYTTQLANVGGNVMQGTLALATVMATNPKHASEALRGWIGGFSEGWTQAKAIMETGRGSREFDAHKAGEAGNLLELVDFKRDFPDMNDAWANARQKHVNALRYVTRTMKAVDSLFYYPAREAYARVVTAKLIEGEFQGKELHQQVRRLLHIAPDQLIAAKTKAEKEGYTGIELALRTANIIEDSRRQTTVGTTASDASESFALASTYNNEPEGWAGVIYNGLLPLTQSVAPGGVPVLRLFLPFMRVPTNIFNASMNYTPLGTLRALRGMPKSVARDSTGRFNVVRREFNQMERSQLLAQSIAGSLAMAGLAALAVGLGGGDDDEPWFTVTATGPDDFKKRQQLEATGWRQHSVKVGDMWISYKDSPLIIPLAVVGHVVDAVRYGKQDDELTLGSKITDAMLTAPRAIFDTSMLSGLSTMMDFASGRASGKQVQGFLTRTAASLAVPNLLNQIDRTFNPETREPNGPLAGPGAAIPFVRNTGDVKTDALGEPVKRSPFARFGSVEGNDPLREVLRDKGVFISTPSRSTKLGNEVMDEETYRDYVRISGDRIRKRLAPLVPRLRTADKETVEKAVDSITQRERETVKNMLRSRKRAAAVAPYNPFSVR